MKTPRRSAAVQQSRRAQARLAKILREARALPGLKRMGPKAEWKVQFEFIGSAAMTRLNARWRGKKYATDVLSFPAPDFFREQGWLGELVICLPVLKRQASEEGHAEARELDVLLAHGVLHLLGLDHEQGEKQARAMAQWEKRLLERLGSSARVVPGLIARSRSGK